MTKEAICKKCKSKQEISVMPHQVFSIEYCYKCLKFTKFNIPTKPI